MTAGWFVEGGRDYFTFDHPLHLGHFFRTLVNQQYHQHTFRVIRCNRLSDILQQNGFTGFWRSNDQTTLTATDWRGQIQYPGSDIFFTAVTTFHPQTGIGMQWR